MAKQFSKEPYECFLVKARNLYGKWKLVDDVPLDVNSERTLHECTIESEGSPAGEHFRVWVRAQKMTADVLWGFDYEWGLHFETSAGRSMTGLVVQLGALLCAMQSFEWFIVIDHDTCIKDEPNEPTEFRSKEAVAEHIKRMLEKEFKCSADLIKRGILDQKGYLLLPSQ